jgi:hypothetical protein
MPTPSEPKLGDKTLIINLTTVLGGRKVTLTDLDRAAAAAAAAVRATLEGRHNPYTVEPIQVIRTYGYAPWRAVSGG